MKQSSRLALGLSALLLALTSRAEVTSSRYSYAITRGPWPANASEEEGGAGDARYTTTPITRADIKTVDEMKAAIAEDANLGENATKRRYMAVLFTGWDWSEAGSLMLQAWRKGVGAQFVTAVYDWPERDYVVNEKVTNEDGTETTVSTNLSALSRNGLASIFPLGAPLGSRVQVWPAMALYDAEGKICALEAGLEALTQDEIKTKLATWAAAADEYAELRAKAFAATETDMIDEAENAASTMGLKYTTTTETVTNEDGTSTTVTTNHFTDAAGREITLNVYKAALLAQAMLKLEKQIYMVSYLRTVTNNNSVPACNRKDDFNQIAAWDPDDISGAYRRVTLLEFYDISGTFRASVTSALRSSLANYIDNSRLIKWSDNQYQQALLLGYNLYKATSNSAGASMKQTYLDVAHIYAREAVRQSPASFWGEAGRGRLEMNGFGPVMLGFGWKARNLQATTGITTTVEDMPIPATMEGGKFEISAEEVARQDGMTIETADGTTTFKWVLRYGNDFKFPKQGWYTVKMAMNNGGTAMTVTGFKIYRGTGRLDDYTAGTLLFDGTSTTAAKFAPTNGDTMGSFQGQNFTSGVSLTPGGSFSFTFYMPQDPDRLFPRWERDWGDEPKYNDMAIEITGTTTGTSAGSFAVTPLCTAAAATAPNATQVTVDGDTLEIGSAFGTLDGKVADIENLPQGTVADRVGDRVMELLGLKANSEGTVTTNETYLAALTYADFFYEHQSARGFEGKVAEALQKDLNGQEAINALLADKTWLTDLLTSGPSSVEALIYNGSADFGNNKAQMRADLIDRFVSVWNFDKIYVNTQTKNGTFTDRRGKLAAAPGTTDYDAFLRRMAVAAALNNTPKGNGLFFHTWLCYRDFADRALLHGDFYCQTPFQMRMSYNSLSYSTLDLMHSVKTAPTRIDYINGTAWQTNYRTWNFFGDSIFGADYYVPWSNSILTGLALGREIGAVCGGISKYGAMAANSSGRRSITAGQPGHCAGTHRTFDGSFWEIDSNVNKYTGNHYQLYGISAYPAIECFDDVFDDPRTREGYYILWAARLRALRYGDDDPGALELYFRAIEHAPLCYQAIIETRDFLTANYPLRGDLWLRWAEDVTYGFWRYPMVGWTLLAKPLATPIRATYGQEGFLATFKQLQVRMHDTDRKTRESYDYLSYMLQNALLANFADTELLSVLGTALDARYGTQRFTELVNWGNSYYGSDIAYQTMLDAVYKANGNKLGLSRTCMETLLAASQNSAVATFREMNDLYRALFHKDDENYPIVSEDEPLYSQEMLSANGCITLSSYPTLNVSGTVEDLHQSALAFCDGQRVIDDSAFATYAVWTQEQYDEPWVMVQLPGDAEIFGVVVQNGDDPVTVYVEHSADGNSWSTLLANRSLAAKEILQVPYDGSTVSRYVRIRRPNPNGDGMRLHLYKVQVFAKRRY
ncbi:MAG: discoidin domain-containing protein [Candidatus Spyradenecus sp.]